MIVRWIILKRDRRSKKGMKSLFHVFALAMLVSNGPCLLRSNLVYFLYEPPPFLSVLLQDIVFLAKRGGERSIVDCGIAVWEGER